MFSEGIFQANYQSFIYKSSFTVSVHLGNYQVITDTVSFRPHVQITHHTGSWTELKCISSRITDPYEHPPNEVRNGVKTHFFRSRTATYSIHFFYLLSLPIWFVPKQPPAPLCPMATSQHWGNHRIWVSLPLPKVAKNFAPILVNYFPVVSRITALYELLPRELVA